VNERQVERLAACVSAIASVPNLTETIRGTVQDIIGAGMEGAVGRDDGSVTMRRRDMEARAHSLVTARTHHEILDWVTNDVRAVPMIEEVTRINGGWKGGRDSFIALLRQSMEYELMRIVYAALLSVKTVTIE